MGKISWSETSIEDLIRIAQFHDIYSEQYSSAITTRLFQKPNILKTMPRIGRIVPESDDENIRELIEGNYRIIYALSEHDDIEILTVHHSSRPLPSNLP